MNRECRRASRDQHIQKNVGGHRMVFHIAVVWNGGRNADVQIVSNRGQYVQEGSLRWHINSFDQLTRRGIRMRNSSLSGE